MSESKSSEQIRRKNRAGRRSTGGARRLEPTAPGRRAKRRREPRLPIATIGASLLIVAMAGVVYVGTQAVEESPVGDSLAIGDAYWPSSTDLNLGNIPDVSRSFDRESLEQQTQHQAALREQALAELVSETERRAEELRARQWVLPVVSYRISSLYGEVSSIRSWRAHSGIDLAAPMGTPVLAAASGTVTHAGPGGACGLTIKIANDDGWEMTYCHQSSLAANPGEQVRPGDVVGYVGSTGNSTGPHLHIEVRRPDGIEVNPAQAFAEHGVEF